MVIGDGSWGGHSTAIRSTTALRTQHGIKTFTVAYGGGIGSWGIRNFRAMAGVTLIEILIGIVISMIMMGAMFTSYTVVNNSYSQVSDKAQKIQIKRHI